MNAKELETQHNLKKWAAIIKECRSSGMKILHWLEINNISKDQYYYWQRKLKETCIDTLERQAATFVELPVTKEVPTSTELINNDNNFELKMIGEGSYAKVFRYRDEFYNKFFVLKRAKNDLNDKELERFKREFDVMNELKSPYVLEVHRYDEEKNEYYMEYADETLKKFI